MRTVFIVLGVTLVMASAGCADKKAPARELMAQWDEACKAEPDGTKNDKAKAVLEGAMKDPFFKEAYDKANPSKYGGNICARGLRADTGAPLDKK